MISLRRPTQPHADQPHVADPLALFLPFNFSVSHSLTLASKRSLTRSILKKCYSSNDTIIQPSTTTHCNKRKKFPEVKEEGGGGGKGKEKEIESCGNYYVRKPSRPTIWFLTLSLCVSNEPRSQEKI